MGPLKIYIIERMNGQFVVSDIYTKPEIRENIVSSIYHTYTNLTTQLSKNEIDSRKYK